MKSNLIKQELMFRPKFSRSKIQASHFWTLNKPKVKEKNLEIRSASFFSIISKKNACVLVFLVCIQLPIKTFIWLLAIRPYFVFASGFIALIFALFINFSQEKSDKPCYIKLYLQSICFSIMWGILSYYCLDNYLVWCLDITISGLYSLFCYININIGLGNSAKKLGRALAKYFFEVHTLQTNVSVEGNEVKKYKGVNLSSSGNIPDTSGRPSSNYTNTPQISSPTTRNFTQIPTDLYGPARKLPPISADAAPNVNNIPDINTHLRWNNVADKVEQAASEVKAVSNRGNFYLNDVSSKLSREDRIALREMQRNSDRPDKAWGSYSLFSSREIRTDTLDMIRSQAYRNTDNE